MSGEGNDVVFPALTHNCLHIRTSIVGRWEGMKLGS